MAKQFSVIVNNNEYIFPSGNVRVVKNGELAFIEFNGGIFNTTSTIDEITTLANTGGTEQIKLTVVRLNDSMQVEPIPMSFPVSNITVNDSTLSGSYSVVTFKGVKYYVTETQEQILTASNSGGGSGDTPTLDEVLAEGSTLTLDRSIELAPGLGLSVSDGSNILSLALSVSSLASTNLTDGGNNGIVSVSTTETQGEAALVAGFNGGVKVASLSVFADATASTITHTADSHTFNGRVIGIPALADNFANDTLAAAGGIALGGAYHTAGACRIRIV